MPVSHNDCAPVKFKFHFSLISLLSLLTLLLSCTQQEPAPPRAFEEEVFYHVLPRSFYDSDGDREGDFQGLIEKLDYLQELGVTAVLMLPIYDSDYYHNYFANDFEAVDPEYGGKEGYFELLEALHQRGMKLFMDMEIHYVTERHPWYTDSYGNPHSPYSKYIIYNGPGNTEPESIIFGLTALQSYDGDVIKICTIDLGNPQVRDYLYGLFRYWVDPNGDGDFRDGIDGYRIDHIMDDLDWKGKQTNLLSDFWKPLFQQLRQQNPAVKIIGEQAEWGYGKEYFAKGDLDAVFAFPLYMAVGRFNKQDLMNKIDSTFLSTPAGKHQLVFIENHDTDRFASVVAENPGKLRVGAALNILLKGIPSIYYGQELGMKGVKQEWGPTDANDILRREAFEWYQTVDGPGMALWYRDSGPWWDLTNLRDDDGISLEEQQATPGSLWQFYRQLLTLRREHAALASGEFAFIPNEDEKVLSFLRWNDTQYIAVIVNLDENPREVTLDLAGLPQLAGKALQRDLLSGETFSGSAGFSLDGYGVRVVKAE